MDQNKLESVFNKRFNNHTEDVDTQEMINRLGLDKPKKQRRPFFIWMLLGALLFVVGGFLFVGEGVDQTTVTLSIPETQSNSETEVVNDESIESKKSQPKLVETLTCQVEMESKDTSQSKENSLSKHSKLAVVEKYNDRSEIQILSQTSVGQSMVSSDLSSTISTANSLAELYANYTPQVNDKTGLSSLYIKSAVSQPIILSRYYSQKYEHPIPVLKFSHSISQSDLSNNVVNERITLPTLIEGYITVSAASRILESNRVDYQDYIENRKLDEEQLEVIQGGLSVTQPIGKHLYISGGLEYTQINERATLYFINDTTLVQDNVPTHLQILTTGDTIVTFGSQSLSSTVNRTLIEYNHHKLFSLPINVGFNQRSGKISWFADTGISLNLYQGFYGRMKGVEGGLVNQPTSFKPHLNFSYRAQIGGSYAISHNFDLVTSLKYQRMLSSISDTNFFSQKYTLIGLSLGIRYQWNK